MTSGFRPLGTHGLERVGTCGLCGTVGPLTKTHVPPKGAGNDQPSATMGYRNTDGIAGAQPGSPREGGAFAWLLCETCNGLTGRYDEDFIKWWTLMVIDWPNIDALHSGEMRIGSFRNARPGAFVRSVLGGMFAFNPTLRERFPSVASAILTGDRLVPPTDFRLLFSAYRGSVRGVLGMMAAITQWPDGRASMTCMDGEWAWPPMHFMLTNDEGRVLWPNAMDITPWLRDLYATRRDVTVTLGVLDLHDLHMARFMRRETD